MKQKKWGFFLLTSFVIGNMLGGGIFMLPRQLAEVASPLATILAWLVTGIGVLMLAFVFGNLAIRRPDLTSGPQSHAFALFRNPKSSRVAGFSMVWAYWVANWAGNVAVITSFVGYLGYFFPIINSTNTLFKINQHIFTVGQVLSFVLCSILLWGVHTILISGFQKAGKLNLFSTIAKVAGFVLFIVIALFAFQSSNLGQWYTPVHQSGHVNGLFSQINQAALLTLWGFIGIEAAILLANRAKSPENIKYASIIGLIITVAIYTLISLLTMGVLTHAQLLQSSKPLADALDTIVPWGGGDIMAVLALISLFGSIIGWILVSAESPYQAAKNGLFPAKLAKTNSKGTPIITLTITNIMSQLFIFSTLSGSVADAFDFVVKVSTLAFIIPYLVSPLFQLKLTLSGETYGKATFSRVKDAMIAILAFVYSAWEVIVSSGNVSTFILGICLFIVGFIIYPLTMKNKY